MASSIARRSTFLRTMMKSMLNATSKSSSSTANSSRTANILFPNTSSTLSQSPLRLLRRELSSLLPVHSAIASASLVSKLPSEMNASAEGLFANYLSPI